MSDDVRQAMNAAKREPLDALTGLRFFAAAWVVLYHYAGAALPAGTPSALRNVVSHGYVGVNFFYLLSGFILAYNYVQRSPSAVAMRGTARAFWWNRFSRIFPMYLVAWAAAAPFVVAHRFATDASPVVRALKLAAAAFVSLGLVQAWIPGATAWWNPPGWSISVEAFFYAIFPWVLPRLLNSKRSRIGLALAAWLGSLVVPSLYVWSGSGELALAAVKYGPLFHLPTFVLGIVLAELFESPSRSRLVRARLVLGGLGVSAIVLVVTRPLGSSYPLIHNGLLSPAFGAVILAVALGAPSLVRVLSAPVLVRLGEASFGLYILQAPLWLTWRKSVEGLPPSVDFALFFVVLCSVSMVAHRLIELPLQRRLRATSSRNAG